MAIDFTNPDAPCWHFVPLVEATTPPAGIIEHIADSWWLVHPERGIVYYKSGRNGRDKSPQCNRDKRVAEKLNKCPWAEIRLLSSVFHRINVSDYLP